MKGPEIPIGEVSAVGFMLIHYARIGGMLFIVSPDQCRKLEVKLKGETEK